MNSTHRPRSDKSSALEELRSRREGKKRIQDYKLKDDMVYDVVSDE